MRKEKRIYYANHKEEKQEYDIEYRKNNKKKIAQYKKEWEYARRNDPIFKIKRNLRKRIYNALRGRSKSKSTFKLLGCTIKEFKLHIEKQFQPGMTWNNWSPKGWHIDHIIPCYMFNLTIPEEQEKCFHYSNQRPLWWYDNLSRPRNILP